MDFVLNEYHRNISDEELLNDIVRVAKTLGKESITRKEYLDNGGLFHISTIEKRFDGWFNALDKSGLTPSATQIATHGIPDNDLILDLQRVAKKLGKKTSKLVSMLQWYEKE